MGGQVHSVFPPEGHPHIVGCASDGTSFSSLDLAFTLQGQVHSVFQPEGHPHIVGCASDGTSFSSLELAFTLQGEIGHRIFCRVQSSPRGRLVQKVFVALFTPL